MEDDLNLFEKGRRPNFFENRRRPKYFWKGRRLIFSKIEDDHKKMQLKAIKCKNNTILENGRQPQFI